MGVWTKILVVRYLYASLLSLLLTITSGCWATWSELKKEEQERQKLERRLEAMRTLIRESEQKQEKTLEQESKKLSKSLEQINARISGLASTVGEVDKVARQGQGGTAEMFTTLQALQENFQRALGQIEELQKQIQEIIQSRPEQLKQLEEIRKKYESLLKDQKALAEQAIPARLFSKARDEFQAKQWDEALKSFQTFAQRFGSHPLADNAYLYIGNIHEKRDQLNPAILAYNELVKLYPHGSQVPVALFRLGLLHYKLGRCPQGIAYFRKLSLYRRQAKELAQEAQKFIKRSRQLCKTKNIRRSRPKRKKHR